MFDFMEQQWSVPAKVWKQDLDNHLRGLCIACQASTIAKTKTTCYQSCKDTRTRRFSNSKFSWLYQKLKVSHISLPNDFRTKMTKIKIMPAKPGCGVVVQYWLLVTNSLIMSWLNNFFSGRFRTGEEAEK